MAPPQDLKKAVDIVDYSILLAKVGHYGFRAYLAQRKQYTFIEREKSSLLEILLGIPQGSIIGPLLVLLFFDNLPLATQLLSLLTADDTSLCNDSDDIDSLFLETNLELSKAEAWFLAIMLTLHPAKTKFMLFSTMNTTKSLYLMGLPIERIHEKGATSSFKLVGVHLDERLSWKQHINHVKVKVARAMSLICRAKHYLPKAVKVLIAN
jgi:hypothetical protein